MTELVGRAKTPPGSSRPPALDHGRPPEGGGDDLETKAFYTVPDLARRWDLSVRQVRRFIALGELKVTRFGAAVRVAGAEVARFEAARTGVI